MTFRQIFLSLKKSKLLVLLLTVFFVKQLFWVAIFPIFQGPDEPAHYSTIQYYAETKEEKSKAEKIETPKSKGFDFSEELANTKNLTESDKISFHSSRTQSFTNTANGQFEEEIKNSHWKKYIEKSDPVIVNGLPGYYFVPSLIEKILSGYDIFFRFFSIRIFSTILGLIIVFLSYLSARKIGFDEKISLLISAIIAFQPIFSQTSTIINYDIMLIFTFAFFIYGAIWSLKDGLNWKNGALIFSSSVLGIITKAPAVVLWLTMLALVIYFSKKYLKIGKWSFFLIISVFIILLILFVNLLFPENYLKMLLPNSDSTKFTSVFQSMSKYFSVTLDRWSWSEISYWGNFGWLDTRIPSWIVNIAHYVEIASIAGVIAYFSFPQKIPEFLPKKKFVIFLIGIFLALQFAIRFADWNHFDKTGKIEIGTYGRYFLPVIFAQFFLIAIGIGMLARKYSIWKNILKILALSMIILWIYATLMVIIPRYYL